MSFDPMNMGWRKLLKNGQVGSVETVSIEWDGNTEGKFIYDCFGDDVGLAMVSGNILTDGEYELTFSNGEKSKVTLHELEHGIFTDGCWVVSSTFTGEDSLGTPVKKGTYFTQPSYAEKYVKSVKQETVHPIDPKYIPAMDSITLNGTDGKQYKLTVKNGAVSVTAV